jgi:D-beta-D-heptose 7-phosphate kinase/D-beta-D-heptose 1-phosphate adenosyltransferase
MKKYKVILISGGFDPVHKGHIECIQNAKELADEVWIGLNNDRWLRNKKGKYFMDEKERAFVMDNIKGVDWVYIMNPKIQNDETAVDFIDSARHKWMRERGTWEEGVMAFGNGGDRVAGGVPATEEDVCKGYGIDMVWGLGNKVQSSSWLLEKYNNTAV